ncbi:cation/H(+) antiporter 4-like [Abrus precatorius]|uniref:Cation/H(+) antiporter 4-like n=1 Tax=Abrus precatorius TaxID=3816 RepID=A0A8B8KAM9_ABRPR|nr:cation/H(+) antiporter 4-like [Abrus precatorius]
MEKYKQQLFPFGGPDILNTVSSLGYCFYLFLNSVQMDLTLITKTGKKAWVIALTSYFAPIIVGYTVMFSFYSLWTKILGAHDTGGLAVVFISHSSCSFAVISSMLNELGILNSELGRLALSSAFVNDITGGIGAGIGAAIVSSMHIDIYFLVRNLVAFLAFIFVIPLIGRPIMRWVVKNTPEGRPVNKIYIYVIIVVFLMLGHFTRYFNQPFVAAAVIFGLAVPEGPPLGSELVYQLELFSTWFLSSIFVTCCIMKVDLNECGPLDEILILSCFVFVVHVVKMIVCMGICRSCSMPTTDGFCLALIMSCKGSVDICSYILIYDAVGQSKTTIGVMVVSVLVLGSASRLGVKFLYDPSRKYAGYQKRNIMNLKHNSELRVVACIHKPYHTVHVRNVLQLCSPAPENTLVADVLHLMELVGRSTPIFIAHKIQQSVGSSYNYSGEVIVTFDLFERDYAGSATANTYTAISPVTLMHEDVCHLALDKNASLIILPFHIKWGGDGSIESDDINIRSLNSTVLERAPCSIGILVNRGSSGFNSTSYNVAMVFLGGPDDREALCLAKRFAKNIDNKLFVYRLLAHDHDSTNWEHMIDDEELREVRGAYVKLENVTYEERTIDDASQTTNFIKDIATKFDFIVVGRRNGVRTSQTSGLENWTEYTELGVIGDLLASTDMETKASILVVQQQTTSAS